MLNKSNTKIKAIIWDQAGVLGKAKCGSFAQLWVDRLDVPMEDVIRVLTSPEHDLLDLGEINKDEFFDFVIQDIGLPVEKKAALNSVCWDDLIFDVELNEYIKNLKSHYITAMLSNMSLYLQEMIDNNMPEELSGVFDHVIVSCYVNLIKPDPKIYQLALDRIGCEAKEAVFIDDSEKNVVGAEKLGIHGIFFQNREQAIKELESILSLGGKS